MESNDYHLLEVRADRQPVGKYEYYTPFVNHEMTLLEGDKGKKMKSKKFKKLLLDIQNEPMEQQHNILNKHFFNWKNDFEQIDDVCVFGVKV